MSIRYDHFGHSEESLQPIRQQLYHSSGPGYAVFPGYLSDEFVTHLRELWSELPQYMRHERFTGWKNLHWGNPNLEDNLSGGSRFFVNFFWNPPACDASHAIALSIAILRNRIEQKAPTQDLFGEKFATAYRVVQTRRQDVGAPWHTDWVEPNTYDPCRLQATLILAEEGRDYRGDGMVFFTTEGRRISFGRDLKLKAGDLILWRYAHAHAVLGVHSDPGQLGFMRIIFPPEILYPKSQQQPAAQPSPGPTPVQPPPVRIRSRVRSGLRRLAGGLRG